MIKTFDDLIRTVQKKELKTLSVAVAQDSSVLTAVNSAVQKGLIKEGSILVGSKLEIEKIAKQNNIDITNYQIEDIDDKQEACLKAVEIVHNGQASLLMKGFVDTSIILKAVLNKEIGLTTGRLFCHVGVLSIPNFNRFLIISDSAMIIAPTLNEKVDIIKNSVIVAKALGIEIPKVAVLCAVEKTNPKMPATIDAEQLSKMNESGEIAGCIVKGPLALDNAVSVEAAKRKGINHPVAGNADILITPDIEAGNILNKSMEYFGNAKKAGIIMGPKRPIVLTSRASSVESKLYSIALGALVTNYQEEWGI